MFFKRKTGLEALPKSWQLIIAKSEATVAEWAMRREEMLGAAAQKGFIVRHRAPGIKFNEAGATFLYDRANDPYMNYHTVDLVNIKGPLVPALVKPLMEDPAAYVDYGTQTFQVLGFVEVPAKVGQCAMKLLYCTLARCENISGTPVCIDRASGKVELYWSRSLKKNNNEERA